MPGGRGALGITLFNLHHCHELCKVKNPNLHIQALPWLYVAFVCICLPWRIIDFVREKWTFFLLDFCYCVNVTVALCLMVASPRPRLCMAAYALADGPLAAALIAWQSAWLMGSPAHSIRFSSGSFRNALQGPS